MTGTYVEASSKVFVLTGNGADRTLHNNKGLNTFHECLVPYSHWGTNCYFFPPFNMTGWTSIKIISWENNGTTVL